MCGVPQNLNSAVASLAQLVSPSVALPAQLVLVYYVKMVKKANMVYIVKQVNLINKTKINNLTMVIIVTTSSA